MPSTPGSSDVRDTVPRDTVPRDTVAARLAEQLRLEIARGSLPGGAPLRQNEVASRSG